MARVSTYCIFPGNGEEALAFYAKAFGTEVTMLQRFGDIPADGPMPPMADSDAQKLLHAELPILGGHILMVTDVLESAGQSVTVGNNTTINLEPDSREEVDRLFAALSEGDESKVPPSQMFWGAYWGVCLDKFDVRWMFNFQSDAAS